MREPALETRALGRGCGTPSGRNGCARTGSHGSRTRPARATPTWCGSAPERAENAPDAVVYPASADEVRAVLDACAEERRRRGPVRRRHQRRGRRRAAAGVRWTPRSRSTSRRIDHARAGRHAFADRRARSRPARARRRARARGDTGLTLGHFPAVVGVRDARRMGRHPFGRPGIDRIRQHRQARRRAALRRPVRRDRSLRALPATAAGPGLRQLLVGSEGVLGVITEATVRVRPLPDATHYEGWMFRGFEQGAEAFRALEQGHVIPDVARLSDEAETRQALTPLRGRLARPARGPRVHRRAPATRTGASRSWASRARARTSTCRRARARRIMRRGGGLALGAAPGPCLAAAALRGPVPARRAARPRHHGGDARDRGAVVRPDGPLRGGPGGDRAARSRHAARPGA